MMNRIQLANRTHSPQDPIDHIFATVPHIDKKRQEQGLPPIIHLSVGEPHLSMNEAILHGLSQYISEPEASKAFYYSPLAGRPQTLAAISSLYKHYYPALDYAHDEVMICNGATQGLWNAFNLLIDPGDVVLVFEPYYSSYNAQVEMLGGKLVKLATCADEFRPSEKTLENALIKYKNAKAIILNYPNNPTGIDLTKQEATQLAQTLKKYSHVAVIIDDVYRELTLGEHVTILDVDPTLKDRCIVINSASKSLMGAPGMRAGMIGANSEWIKYMTTLQATAVCGVSYLTEQVLVSAIQSKLEKTHGYIHWLEKTKQAYSANMSYVAEQLSEMGFNIISGGNGFFVLVDAGFLLGEEIPDHINLQSAINKQPTINGLKQTIGSSVFKTDYDIVAYLLHVAGVAVIPGSAFGIDQDRGFLRFSCAKDMGELKQALINIQHSLNCVLQNSSEKKVSFRM